jgi:hypothetical protein
VAFDKLRPRAVSLDGSRPPGPRLAERQLDNRLMSLSNQSNPVAF